MYTHVVLSEEKFGNDSLSSPPPPTPPVFLFLAFSRSIAYILLVLLGRRKDYLDDTLFMFDQYLKGCNIGVLAVYCSCGICYAQFFLIGVQTLCDLKSSPLLSCPNRTL